jgi:hypothetical protein
MYAPALLLVVGVPVLLVALVALLFAVLRRGRPEGHDATVVAARRHEARISTASAVSSVGAALAVGNPAVTSWGPSGLLLGLAPFAAALVFSLARIVGESRWPRPTGEVRTAPLVRRSLWDQGGWRLRVFLGTAGALGIALVAFGLTAADDGRSVERTIVHSGDLGTEVLGAGPYPGWPLGGPALVLLALAVAGVLVALHAVTRRPPIGLLSTAQDDAIRRTSAARLLAGVQVWVGLGAAGHLAFGGSALVRVGWSAGGFACLVLALVALVGSVVVAAPALLARRSLAGDAGPRATPAGSPA